MRTTTSYNPKTKELEVSVFSDNPAEEALINSLHDKGVKPTFVKKELYTCISLTLKVE